MSEDTRDPSEPGNTSPAVRGLSGGYGLDGGYITWTPGGLVFVPPWQPGKQLVVGGAIPSDGGYIMWTPGGLVFVPPWRPREIVVGDPRIDGGWNPLLIFLDALRESLDDKSEEAFHRALSTEENAKTIAQLHRKKPKTREALEAELLSLQEELRSASPANKAAIVKRIVAILQKLN